LPDVCNNPYQGRRKPRQMGVSKRLAFVFVCNNG
jgi:hypothetical protein